MENQEKTIEQIKLTTLPDALKAMSVGETKAAPEGLSDDRVRGACSELNQHGYIFRTERVDGIRMITRLK